NIDFMNLVLMLNQNALISLGEAPRFVSGSKKANLPHARQTINMIKAIQDKTRGQLSSAETKLIFRILGELQKKYVVASGLMSESGEPLKQKNSQNDKDPLSKGLDNLDNSQLANLLSELQKKSK
ncbi:MAG: DUF1844 domain-containing protein, partial [bacterium]